MGWLFSEFENLKMNAPAGVRGETAGKLSINYADP